MNDGDAAPGRQVSYAHSMAFYENPAIDQAVGDFLLTALCGEQETRTLATWTPRTIEALRH